MNFGNTLEEQYAKISAINALLKKWSKTCKIVFLVAAVCLTVTLVFVTEEKLKAILFGLLYIIGGYFSGGYFGKIYCWAWILLCQKHKPELLVSSLSNAVHNSAVDGYVFGGTSGAKSAALGALLAAFLFAAFYIGKGQRYAKKYRSLPQKEAELKKQLEAKYGKTF